MPYASIEEITEAVAGQTTPRLFLKTVEAHGDVVALRSMRGADPGAWNEWTFDDYARHVGQRRGRPAPPRGRAG